MTMKIEQKEIFVREVVKGYIDNAEEGVYGYGGKLNIRPKYQREFVYKDKQREAVINTIINKFPLNTMYWMRNEDGTYEVLDGQQRTISICQYVNNDFSITIEGSPRGFSNLTDSEKEAILNYKLQVYFCTGSDKERLDWFRIINIAGEKLSDQELRNAIYTGQWLTDAKRYFSRTGCPASEVGNKYLNGKQIRQEFLESALKWISDSVGLKSIEDYMAVHQHDPQAVDLWNYFTNVINWVKAVYPEYNKVMKDIEWGLYYNKFSQNKYDPKEMTDAVHRLIDNDEIQSVKGIYEYLLDNDEKHLNLRQFSDKEIRNKSLNVVK